MASTNDASARIMSVLKGSAASISGKFKVLVKAQYLSEVETLLRSINPSLATTLKDTVRVQEDYTPFTGRAPPAAQVKDLIHGIGNPAMTGIG